MTSNPAPQTPDAASNTWLHAEYNGNADPDAFERWRYNLAEVLDVSVDEASRKTFSAHISVAQAGYGLLMKTKADAQFMTRSARHIRRDAIDHFCIAFLQSGRNEGDYHHISSCADTTSILFADEAQESRRHYSRFEALRLLIPRGRIPKTLRYKNVHGLTVPIAQAGASLLASHVLALTRRIDELTKPEAEAAIDAALLLLPGALNASRPCFEPLDPAFDASMIAMIKTYIESHLYGAAASPAVIAETFGLSRSSLYRLFECEGGVARYIINKKLDFARHLLSNGKPVSIRAVGEMMGFKSEAHFSRAFKKKFFMTPREARQLSLEAMKLTEFKAAKIEVERRMLEMFQTIGKT